MTTTKTSNEGERIGSGSNSHIKKRKLEGGSHVEMIKFAEDEEEEEEDTRDGKTITSVLYYQFNNSHIQVLEKQTQSIQERRTKHCRGFRRQRS